MSTTTRRHEPTADCSGLPRPTHNPFGYAQRGEPLLGSVTCPECGQELCPCEEAYGHDCEA